MPDDRTPRNASQQNENRCGHQDEAEARTPEGRLSTDASTERRGAGPIKRRTLHSVDRRRGCDAPTQPASLIGLGTATRRSPRSTPCSGKCESSTMCSPEPPLSRLYTGREPGASCLRLRSVGELEETLGDQLVPIVPSKGRATLSSSLRACRGKRDRHQAVTRHPAHRSESTGRCLISGG